MISVVNKYKHTPTPNDVYIGRGSPFGNPYSHMDATMATYKVATRDEAVDCFRQYFLTRISNDAEFAAHVNKLKHKCSQGDVNLVCFCKPQRCHGDIIKECLENS